MNEPFPTPDLQAILDPAQLAVLVVDVQNDFVHPRGRAGAEAADMTPSLEAVIAINNLVQSGRRAGARIAYVRTEHGPHVDVAPYQARYARRGMTPDDTICHAGTWGAELFGELVAPEPGDLQVVKHGYDAFQRTALADELRAHGVQSVVVTGVVTNLCVRASAYSAFEQGFFVVVPRETTAAVTPELKARTLEDIQAYYGEVVDIDELLAAWDREAVGTTTHDAGS